MLDQLTHIPIRRSAATALLRVSIGLLLLLRLCPDAAAQMFTPMQNVLHLGGVAFDQVNGITTTPDGNIYLTGTFMGDGAQMGFSFNPFLFPVTADDWNRDIPPRPGVVDTTALPFDTYQRAAFIAQYNPLGLLTRLVTIGCLDGAEGTGIVVTTNACTGEAIIYATGYYNGPVRVDVNGQRNYWYPDGTVDKGVDGPKSPYLLQILPDGQIWARFSIKGDTDDPSMKGLGLSLRPGLPLPCDNPLSRVDFNKLYVYGDYQDYAGFVAKFDNTSPLNRAWTKGLGKIKGLGQDDHGETAEGEFYQYGIKVNSAAPGYNDSGAPKVFVTGTVVGEQPLTQRSGASDLHRVSGGEKGAQWVAEIDDADSDVGWYRQLFADYPSSPFWTQLEIDTDKRLLKDTLIAPQPGQTVMDLGRGYRLELSAAPQFASGKLISYDDGGLTVGGDYAGDLVDRTSFRSLSGTPFSGAYVARYTKRGDIVWMRTIQGGSQLSPARRDSSEGHFADYSQDPGITLGALAAGASTNPTDLSPRLFITGQVHGFNTNSGFGGDAFAVPFDGEPNGDVFSAAFRRDGSPVWDYILSGGSITRPTRGLDRQDEAHAVHLYENGLVPYSPYQGLYIGGSFDSLSAFNFGPVQHATPGVPGMSIRLRKYEDTIFDQDPYGHVIGSHDVRLATLDTVYTLSHQDGYLLRDDQRFAPPPAAPASVAVTLDTTAADPTGAASTWVRLSFTVELPPERVSADGGAIPVNPATGLPEQAVSGYLVTRHPRTAVAAAAAGRLRRQGSIREASTRSSAAASAVSLKRQIEEVGYLRAMRQLSDTLPLPPAVMRFLAREDSVHALRQAGLPDAITGADEPPLRGPTAPEMTPRRTLMPGPRQGTRYAVGDLVEEADPRTMHGQLQTYGDGTLIDAQVVAILQATTADSSLTVIDSLPAGTTASDWGYRVYLFVGNPEPMIVTDTLVAPHDSAGVALPPVLGSHYILNRHTTGTTPYFSAERLVGSDSDGLVVRPATRPVRNRLYPASPNPFNPTTTLRFDLMRADPHAVVSIYDMLGRLVKRLDTAAVAGPNQIRFDGSGFSSGVYIYRITSGPFTASRRFTLLK